ncbi:MAG: PAS domain S-box protein [Chloroflexi bacterium]|nr:PAS domain S-box protein [Chloroflexota bacterium]
MAFYSVTTGFFDSDELILLDELAGDVAFAMEFAEQDALRQEQERALERSARRLEVMHQIDLGLLHGGSIEELIAATLRELRTVIPCRRVSVGLIDESANEMVVFAGDLDGPSEVAKGHRVPLPPPDWSVSFRADGLLLIPNVHAMTDPPATYRIAINEGMVSILHVLLTSEGKRLGVLNLFGDTPEFFTAEYQQIALEVGSQLTIAIHQHHLSEAVRRYTEDLESQVAARTVALQAAKEQVEEAKEQVEEAKMEAILNNSLDGILFLDEDLRIVQVNPAFTTLLGYSLNAPHALSLIEIIHPDDQSRLVDVAERLITDPNGQYVEVRVCRQDDTTLDAEIGMQAIPGDGYVCGIRDNSARKAYERELLFNASLQENVTNAVISMDLEYRIRTWNKAAARMYGWSAGEAIGQFGYDLLRPQVDGPNSIEQVERELLDNGFATAEVTHLHKDGTLLFVLSSVVLFRDTSGVPLGVVSVNHDISERRKAEQALRQALDLEKQAGLLKSRFVSMASHEFRTPLAGILASTETLAAYRARMTDEQIDGRLDNIRQQVDHMTGIVEDVLQLGRLQSGRQDFHPVEADVDALCREVIAEFPELATGERPFEYACPVSPVRAVVDLRLIRQVITNLISNALKYSAPGKPVRIQLVQDPGGVTFRIRDEGIGIPTADMPLLFEPFHRASNIGAVSGTGLGLSITRQAVERHGGTIDVESPVGAGTTFTITLPAAERGERDGQNPGDRG